MGNKHDSSDEQERRSRSRPFGGDARAAGRSAQERLDLGEQALARERELARFD